MTIKEFNKLNIKIYKNKSSFYYIKELPKNCKLVTNVSQLLIYDKGTHSYKPNIGMLYFIKAYQYDIYFINSMKEKNGMNTISDDILNKRLFA